MSEGQARVRPQQLDVVGAPSRGDGPALRLYVVGRNTLANRALENIRTMMREDLPAGTTLEVVDLEVEPARGDEHRVLATPMLVRVGTDHGQSIVGDLTDRARVLSALGYGPSAD